MEKKNSGIVKVLLLLVGVVIGVGGMFVYNKCIKKESSSSNNTARVEKELNDVYKGIYDFKIGDKNYLTLVHSLYYMITPGNDNVSFSVQFVNEGLRDIYPDKIVLNDKEDYKFDKKIANIYAVELGMNYSVNTSFAVFVMEDGTVEYYKLEDLINKTKETRKIKELKNIKFIMNTHIINKDNSEDMTYVAVDKDGKTYDLSEYLK